MKTFIDNMDDISMLSSDSKWFVREKPNPQAKLRLFCFPYAGGNSSIYNGWQQKLGHDIEVVAIEPPGRGMRFGETPIKDIHQLVNILKKEITPILDKPYVFFGHSNGGLMSFVLSQQLQSETHSSGLQHMIISAKRAPQLPPIRKNLHDASDDEIIAELRLLNATPKEILEDRSIILQFLPLLRADFSLSETHSYNSTIKPEVDISLFCGQSDKDIKEEDMMAWQHTSIGSVKYHAFNGDHFFIHSCKEDVINTVRDIIHRVLLNNNGVSEKADTTFCN